MLQGIRLADFARNALSLLLFLAYTGIRLYLGKGTEWLNWAMLGVTAAYFVFFAATLALAKSRRAKKTGKKIYKWAKRSLVVLNAVMTVGSVWAAGKDGFELIPALFAAYTIVNFVAQVLFAVAIYAVRRKISAFRAVRQERVAERRRAKEELRAERGKERVLFAPRFAAWRGEDAAAEENAAEEAKHD